MKSFRLDKDSIRNLKGIQGFHRMIDISARMKKHYCPVCNGLLRVISKGVVINSESEEAKNFNFSVMDGRMYGNIRFTNDIFYCNECDREFTTRAISDIEKEEKRKLKGNRVTGKAKQEENFKRSIDVQPKSTAKYDSQSHRNSQDNKGSKWHTIGIAVIIVLSTAIFLLISFFAGK